MRFTDETHKSQGISKKIHAVPFHRRRKARETSPTRGSLSPRARGTEDSPAPHRVPGLPGAQASSHPIRPRSKKSGLLKGKKNVPKFRLCEHFHLSDLICREAFSLPPKGARYRVNSPALYIVLMDLVRQHHQALRPYRYCSCIFKRFNLPFSHINLLVICLFLILFLMQCPSYQCKGDCENGIY